MSLSTTITNIGSLTQNPTTAQTNINNNFAAVNTALASGLSLSGQAPNQMTSNLDMNNNQILNLPAPSSANSPVRLTDITNNTIGLVVLSYTFATLPTPVTGAIVIITDSTVNTWGTNVTVGAGTNKVLVWYNGVNWTVIGK